MRTAVIGPGVPHPDRGASSVLFFYYIAALRAAGHDLFHVILSGAEPPPRRDIEAHARRLSLEIGKTVHVVCGARVFSERRFRVVRDDTHLQLTRERLSVFAPDAIVAFDLDAAAVAQPLNATIKTVWLGDLAFHASWYNYIYGLRERPLTLRWLPYALAQRRRWRNRYVETLAGFYPIVVSSGSSVDDLKTLGLSSSYHPYPWPAQSLPPHVFEKRQLPDRPTFLFFGNLTGLGSRSALHFTFREAVPHMRKVWGANGFSLLIAGHAELRDWAKARIESTPEAKFLGFVDDLGDLMRSCHAVLAPVEVPVGNRSRIVTAMALGGLVIAHRNTQLGNPALVNGKTARLFSDAAEMVACMLDAVEKPDEQKPILEAARRVYDTQFSPTSAARLFVDIIEGRMPRAATLSGTAA